MYAILRTAKLKTFGNIASSASHNFRERETLNADPERTHLNIHHGAVSSDEVTAKVKNLLPEKVRSNAVLCIEYLITASPEFFKNGEQNLDYFERAREWLVNKHGEKNIVYSGIQLDEKTPHMVAYVVPIDDKGKLNARHFLGGRENLRNMQTDFAKNVGEYFELDRGVEGSPAKHERVKKFYGNLEKNITLENDIRKKTVLQNANDQRHLAKAAREKTEEVKKQIENRLSPQLAKIDELETIIKGTGLERLLNEVKERGRQIKEELERTKNKTAEELLAEPAFEPRLSIAEQVLKLGKEKDDWSSVASLYNSVRREVRNFEPVHVDSRAFGDDPPNSPTMFYTFEDGSILKAKVYETCAVLSKGQELEGRLPNMDIGG